MTSSLLTKTSASKQQLAKKIEEIDSLIEEFKTKCSFTWTQLNGIWGCYCKGPNGNSIFLPAAGSFTNGKTEGAIEFVRIWSSTICTVDYFAYGLGICRRDNYTYVFSGGKRSEMHPIRPVQDY